jgi:hypothetical protein
MATARFVNTSVRSSVQSTGSKGFCRVLTPRIREVVIDEPLHVSCPRHGVGDELVSLGIELGSIVALQDLHAFCNSPEWLLQVMGGSVG